MWLQIWKFVLKILNPERLLCDSKRYFVVVKIVIMSFWLYKIQNIITSGYLLISVLCKTGRQIFKFAALFSLKNYIWIEICNLILNFLLLSYRTQLINYYFWCFKFLILNFFGTVFNWIEEFICQLALVFSHNVRNMPSDYIQQQNRTAKEDWFLHFSSLPLQPKPQPEPLQLNLLYWSAIIILTKNPPF